MDILWSRFLRALYRKEPIVGFVATVGVVDAAIGGLTEHWSLLTLGLGTVGGAIALRLWQLQRQSSKSIKIRCISFLPSLLDPVCQR
jgi:hypothetical protein